MKKVHIHFCFDIRLFILQPKHPSDMPLLTPSGKVKHMQYFEKKKIPHKRALPSI